MKKLLLFILILIIMGCAGKKVDEIGGNALKVQVSPHASSLISKRIGVIPFIGAKEDLGIYMSRAVADNLITSGFQVIESKYLLSELKKLLENESLFETNEWEEFKQFFKKDDLGAVTNNLIKLRDLDLVDFLLTGRVKVKKGWFFSKSNEVDEANFNLINVQNGAIIYSLNYNRDRAGEDLTPRELSEKVANALITAMQ